MRDMADSILLDATAGGDYTDGMSLREYSSRCSEQVDAARLWNVVHGAAHRPEDGIVRFGRVRGEGACEYNSTMWTTEWNVPAERADALLRTLDDVFKSGDIAKHAKEWDQTFVRASILADTHDGKLVSWDFAAAPLWGRDLLYMISSTEEEDQSDKQKRVLTYSYASVSDAWAEKLIEAPVPSTGRVRATILFPSCDRVTVCKNEDGTTKIVLEHLMTTAVGGWIGPCLFNSCFKAPLIQANAHECRAMREYVESIAGQLNVQ